MQGEGVRVLVVGAGIAGLAAARTLRAWGASVEVVDRQPEPPREGAGIFLPGSSVRALEALGLGEEVADRAVTILRQRTLDHRGRTLFEVGTDELWQGVAPCLALPRADLHQVLLAGVGDVPVRWGVGPEAVAVDDTGVTVTVAGTPMRQDLVLGADGVHSTVRRLVLGAAAVRRVGQYAWRFVVDGEAEPGSWCVRLGRGTAFLTIPVGARQVYCYADGPLGGPRSLTDLAAGYGDPVPALVAALDADSDVHAGPIEEVELDSWSRGSVLLVGDAAHATSPNMAQGAGMAIEDALVLAASLRSAGSLPEALAIHERRRRPRTEWVRAQTHRRDRARALPPVLRNLVLGRFGTRIQHANYRPLRDEP